MIIGFAGCHRSGKTFAAQKVAESIGAKFIATNVSDITKKYKGLEKNFKKRIKCQKEILAHLKKIIADHDGVDVVLDRTPLDLVVYTLDAYHWANVNDENELILREYMKDCQDLLDEFDFLVKVDMLEEVVEEEGKAPSGLIYRAKLDTMFDGMYTYDHILSGGDHQTRNESIETLTNYLKDNYHGNQ